MTHNLQLRSIDIPSIHKFGVGFDSMFDELMRIQAGHNQTNYPPHNVIRHTDDTYSIEIAIAGFKQGDIEINLDNRVLSVVGNRNTDSDPSPEYIVRGISNRNFTRTFTLAEHVEVIGAAVEDGILTIDLERQVPEAMRPKSIAISYNK